MPRVTPQEQRQASTRSGALSRAQQREEESGSRTINRPDSIGLFKPPAKGRVSLDFLPWAAGSDNRYAQPGVLTYERTYFVHWGLGLQGKTPALCLSQGRSEKAVGACPICDFLKTLDSGHPLIQKMKAKERQLFLVLDTNDPKEEVKLWDFSYHMFCKLLDTRMRTSADDPDEIDFQNFFDPKSGMTLKITFEEVVIGTGKPAVSAKAIDFAPRKKQHPTSLYAGLPCVDEFLVYQSKAALNRLLNEGDSGSSEDDLPETSGTKKEPTEGEEEIPY